MEWEYIRFLAVPAGRVFFLIKHINSVRPLPRYGFTGFLLATDILTETVRANNNIFMFTCKKAKARALSEKL